VWVQPRLGAFPFLQVVLFNQALTAIEGSSCAACHIAYGGLRSYARGASQNSRMRIIRRGVVRLFC